MDIWEEGIAVARDIFTNSMLDLNTEHAGTREPYDSTISYQNPNYEPDSTFSYQNPNYEPDSTVSSHNDILDTIALYTEQWEYWSGNTASLLNIQESRNIETEIRNINHEATDTVFNQSLMNSEETKVFERRKRNNIAATKCRNKKKERINKLIFNATQGEKENIQLRQIVVKLKEEKRLLLKMLMFDGRMNFPHSEFVTDNFDQSKEDGLDLLEEIDLRNIINPVDDKQMNMLSFDCFDIS